MLYGYRIERNRLRQVAGANHATDCQWIDLVAPDDQERTLIDRRYGEVVPDADEMEELEASARYYTDDDGIHVHSLFMYRQDGRVKNGTVAFTLKPDRLITSRDHEMPDFRLLRLRVRNARVEARTPVDVMLTLLEQKVEHLADELEHLYQELDEVSYSVLKEEPDGGDLESDIDELAEIEDTNGKVRLCLMDTQRSVSYLVRHIRDYPEVIEGCREVLRDGESLLAHTNFVSEKVNFLMTAAQGFMGIQQNQIIKIFSIAAVVFLPPTLVASIYGMNYAVMPELQWQYGYPFAVALMIVAGIAPYLFFKRKGWL
ncbi:MAG: magnesium/cobalt transporter CorA [Gammaproteobacteria bacterium]|jgi:magnesium transporter|nr:magnesium/cobalt transporter CorA [Gammaproteobacteria bacterium]